MAREPLSSKIECHLSNKANPLVKKRLGLLFVRQM